MAEVDRNTPTVANLRSQRWYGWGGAADTLWSQSLRAIVDRRELAATPAHVAELVRSDEQLSCRYQRTFGAPPSPTDDEAVFVDVGKAPAAFQETLVSGATPFDQFRDALARGEAPSFSYSEPAQRGLKIFIGKGGCTSCHSGPNFSNGEFFNTGLSRFAPLGKPDDTKGAEASPLHVGVNADVRAGHRRSACPTHAATATKVQWTTPTLASILTHAVTEAGKLSQEFDVVCLGGGVA